MSGPRDWSPRGKFPETIKRVIRELKDSGQSEGIAIGDFLQDALIEDREYFSPSMVMSILEEFEDVIKYVRKEVKKIGPQR